MPLPSLISFLAQIPDALDVASEVASRGGQEALVYVLAAGIVILGGAVVFLYRQQQKISAEHAAALADAASGLTKFAMLADRLLAGQESIRSDIKDFLRPPPEVR
ncbi:MAG: hypothetical protein Rubg2KO_15610 [Rubricoccaceae bacterium]